MKPKFEKDMIFHISKDLLPDLISCVVDAYPNEATGLLFGSIKQLKVKEDFQYYYDVRRFQCVESSHKSPIAFLLDNDEFLFETVYNIEKTEGFKVIGIFHSHPSGTYPSSIDHYYMQFFHDSGIGKFKHLIWIIMDSQNKEAKAFLYFKGNLTQIRLEID
jgi:proteasome lid subunit RPN8/RPN11